MHLTGCLARAQLTRLPNPSPHLCVSSVRPGTNTFVAGVLISFGIWKTCRDFLFSGHTATMTIWLMLVVMQREPRRAAAPPSHHWQRADARTDNASIVRKVLSAASKAVIIVEFTLAIAVIVHTRFHCKRVCPAARAPSVSHDDRLPDSVDVVVAILLVVLLVCLYNTLLQLNHYASDPMVAHDTIDDRAGKFGRGPCLGRFISWFEFIQ